MSIGNEERSLRKAKMLLAELVVVPLSYSTLSGQTALAYSQQALSHLIPISYKTSLFRWQFFRPPFELLFHLFDEMAEETIAARLCARS